MALCQGCHCKLDPGRRSAWCEDCADDMGSRNFDTDEPDTDDHDGEELDFDGDGKGSTMPTTDELPTCRKCGVFLCFAERRRLLEDPSNALCEDCRREELPSDGEEPDDDFLEEQEG